VIGFYEGCSACRKRLCPERCFDCSKPEVIRQGWIHSLGVYYSRAQAEHWSSGWSRAIIKAKQGNRSIMNSFGRMLAWYVSWYLSNFGPCLVTNVPGFPVHPGDSFQGNAVYSSGLIVQVGEKVVLQHRCRTDAQRRRNVVGIYRVLNPDKVMGRNVILLDDVVTTGITLTECAGVLCKAGAGVVVGLTLGKTVRKKPAVT
jgi:phosphoribosylpyrophosphate synthetase